MESSNLHLGIKTKQCYVHVHVCCYRYVILNTVCCHLPPLPPHSSTETSSSVDASVVQELQKALESTQRELRDMKDRKESFERECVIYQSQLEVHVHGVCVEEGER